MQPAATSTRPKNLTQRRKGAKKRGKKYCGILTLCVLAALADEAFLPWSGLLNGLAKSALREIFRSGAKSDKECLGGRLWLPGGSPSPGAHADRMDGDGDYFV
jgi:hypothetical protein